ncbi:hypothetical protein BH10PSE13_BH10PSE13_08700 [soil metagenome]
MDSRILELADMFANAAIDPTQWMSALQTLAHATGSARGQLIGIGGDATVPFNWVNDFPDHAFDEFLAMDGGSRLVNPRVAAAIDAPLLAVRHEADYRATLPGLVSDVYLDFAHDYDFPHGCQTKLFEGDGGLVGLAVLRRESEGETTPDQRAFFAGVAPFVRNAVRMQMALERDGPRLIAGALDQVAAAVFVCASDGRVLAHSAAAESLLHDGRLGLAGGSLRFGGKADQDRFAKVLARHVGPLPVPMETLVIRDGAGNGRLPLLLDIATMPRGPWSLDVARRILVIVRGAGRWHGSAQAVLQTFYGLSPAEADVALRLARGQHRADIAGERGARLETVRSQIKIVFAKLGIGREVELVTMLGQLLRA